MNRRLLMLSGLAILAVVANHASQTGITTMFWWTDRYRDVVVPNYDQMGSLSYYVVIVLQKLTLFSVPTFLFIMGLFLAYAARGAQSRLTWTMIKRRVLNLLPPYILWALVYEALRYLLDLRYPSLVYYLISLVSIEASQFFYVPLVIVYYLISPFLAPVAQNRPRLMLGIGAAILLYGIAVNYLGLYTLLNGLENSPLAEFRAAMPQWKLLEYFFYYVLGMVAGFYQAELRALVVRFRWALLALMIVAGALAVAEAEWIFQTTELITWRSRTLTLPTAIFATSAILCFLGFDQVRLPFSNQLYFLGVNTLGIYMIHKNIILLLPKILYHFLPFTLSSQLIYQPLLIGCAVGVPLLLMTIVRKLPIRRYYRLLFG